MHEQDWVRLRAVAEYTEGCLAELTETWLYAPPDQREALHAGIEFERQLLEACNDCRRDDN